jgi:hypothetical protein
VYRCGETFVKRRTRFRGAGMQYHGGFRQLSSRKWYVLIAAFVLSSWFFALIHISLRVNTLGIFESFPIYYFLIVGAGIAIIEWQLYAKQPSDIIQFLALVFVIISIDVIPTILGALPRPASDVLAFWEQINTVTKMGSFSPIISQLYLNGGFPAFITFFSVWSQLTGSQSIQFAVSWVFVFWQFVYLPFFLLIGCKTVGSRFKWTIPTFFYLYQWLSFNSIAPQTMGFAIFLAICGLLFKRPPRDNKTLLLFLILSAAIIISHGLSTLYAIGTVLVLVLLNRNISWRYPILMCLALAAWLAFDSTSILKVGLHGLSYYLSNPVSIFYLGFLERVITPNYGHTLLNLVRTYYTAAYLVVGLLGFVSMILINKRQIDRSQLSLLFGVLLVFALIGYGYGAEAIDKTLLFASPAVAYFACQTLNFKALRVFLLGLLIVSPSFYVISAYGDQFVSTVPQTVMIGLEYFSHFTPGSGTLTGYLNLWGVPVFKSYTPYLTKPIAYIPIPTFLPNYTHYNGETFESVESAVEGSNFTGQHFVAITVTDRALYTWEYNETNYLTRLGVQLDKLANRVYDSYSVIVWSAI